MREPTRDSNSAARLGCEALEDRATPAAAYGLSGGSLLAFDTAAPAVATTTPVTGVRANEALVGIDFRPQDNALYALGVNAAANTGTLYAVSTATGAATAVGTPGRVAFVDAAGAPVDLPDAAAGYGFDFDPVNDQANVVTGSGLNFRIDPNTGAPIDGNTGAVGGVPGVNPDGGINGLPAGSTGVSATAFAANRGQLGAAVQYTLDAGSNALFIQDRLSSGAQTARVNVTSGGAPLDFTGANGFDIADGVGYAALTTSAGGSRLYRIDLTSGVATDLGAPPQPLGGLAVGSPAGAIAFTGAAFTASETGLAAEITLTRTGGTAGAANVTVTATDGTATAGSDFLPGPYVVAFAAGQSTATLVIPLDDQDGAEPDESFALALSAPTGGATLGAQTTATVTITDATPAAPPVTTAPPAPPPLGVALGAGAGGIVEVLNADQTVQTTFQPFGPTMLGGVRVARGDVTGDGVDDIIVAPVVGAPHVKVFDGVTGAEVRSFLAFDPGFLGGITIAAGDVNGDGFRGHHRRHRLRVVARAGVRRPHRGRPAELLRLRRVRRRGHGGRRRRERRRAGRHHHRHRDRQLARHGVRRRQRPGAAELLRVPRGTPAG